MKTRKQKGYWTGWRAVIEGESFNIRKFIGDWIEIYLPNGSIATVSRYLPDSITS